MCSVFEVENVALLVISAVRNYQLKMTANRAAHTSVIEIDINLRQSGASLGGFSVTHNYKVTGISLHINPDERIRRKDNNSYHRRSKYLARIPIV